MPSEQYRVGYSSVTAGGAVVSGYNTAWNTEVLAGDVYKPDVDNQPTAVIGSVDSATQITLSGNWAGNSFTKGKYLIQRSWSVNKNLARPFQGDADLADILREQVIDKIDTELMSPTIDLIKTTPSGTTIGPGGVTTPKIYCAGGVDPPYVSFSNETHESIKDFSKKITEHERAMLFWNGDTYRLEVYEVKKNRFYTLGGKEIA